MSRDQLQTANPSIPIVKSSPERMDIPLLELLVDAQHLCRLIRLDGVPGGRVALGPDDCSQKLSRYSSRHNIVHALVGPMARRYIYHDAPVRTPPMITYLTTS